MAISSEFPLLHYGKEISIALGSAVKLLIRQMTSVGNVQMSPKLLIRQMTFVGNVQKSPRRLIRRMSQAMRLWHLSQNLRCSHTWSMEVDEGFDQKSDI